MKLIPVKSIISDYLDDTGYEGNVDMIKMQKWGSKIIKKAQLAQSKKQKIVVLDVDEYKTSLPSDFYSLIQIAGKFQKKRITERIRIKEYTQQMYGTDCDLVIKVNCPKCHEPKCACKQQPIVIDVDEFWEKRNPQFKYDHMNWMTSYGGIGMQGIPFSSYHPKFELLRPTFDEFFGAEEMIKGCVHGHEHLMNQCRHEFKIEDNIIRFSEKQGKVILSYSAIKTDEDGFMFVPDQENLIDAIVMKIEERITYRQWRLTGEQHFQRLYLNAKQESREYYNAAKEDLDTPSFNTWAHFLEKYYNNSNRSPSMLIKNDEMLKKLHHSNIDRFVEK